MVEPVDGLLVGAHTVFEWIAPGLHLFLHLLAQVDQGEPRHVAQDVVVSDFLRLLEGGVDFSGKIGIFPVESFAHDDQMHGRVNPGFPKDITIPFHIIGKEPFHLRAIFERMKKFDVGNIRDDGVHLAVGEPIDGVLIALGDLDLDFVVMNRENVVAQGKPF